MFMNFVEGTGSFFPKDLLNSASTILCGDGRNDSPGHSAKYCVYVLMEQFVDVIVDLVVVDKRETGGGGFYQYGSIQIEESIRMHCW